MFQMVKNITSWHALYIYLIPAGEAARIIMATAQIIDIQNAASGMWAAGKGMEELYLIVIFYLLWPICFNFVARLAKA